MRPNKPQEIIMCINKITIVFAMTVMLSSAHASAAPAREVAPPIAPPYSADRKLAATDFLRLDWTDAKRTRNVPVKIYFPADGAGPFPVIVFSHGLGGTRETYEYLGRQWAANGFVVLHLQHIGTDDSAWRGSTQPMQSLRQAITIKSAIDRFLDARFAVDQLETLNRTDEKLKGKLDLKHIGFAGHSYGAHTTQAVAGQRMGARSNSVADERIKAAIAMSPNLPAARGDLDAAFAGITIPIFYMTGTKDDSPVGDTKAAERRIPFDHTKASAAAYFLNFKGGDHMIFSGRPRVAPDPQDAEFQKQIRLASTAFWDAYLKDDSEAKKWLRDGAFKAELGDLGTFEMK
jgi:predicted dienelactone hydrolase